MKTSIPFLFAFILLFCCEICQAQQGSGTGYYYDDFEYASQSAFNTNWPYKTTTSPVPTIAWSQTSPLDGSNSLASIKNTTTPNSISNVLTSSTTLNGTNAAGKSIYWEWSMQYKYNSITNISDVTAAAITTSTKNAWKFWLTADSKTPSTCRGYYLTQKGSAIVLVEKNNTDVNGNAPGPLYNTILTSSNLTQGTSYNIKVQRINTGSQILWRLYINSAVFDAFTLNPNSTTGEPNNSPIFYTGYFASILESVTNDNTTTNYFQWDDIKMYQRSTTVISNNVAGNGVNTSTALYISQPGVVLFSMGIQDIGVTNITELKLSVGPGSPNARFTNTKLIKSTDPYYSTTGDNTTVATGFSIDNTIDITGLTDVAYGSPSASNTYPTVFYYFIVADVSSSTNSYNPNSFKFTYNSLITSDQNYGALDASSTITDAPTFTVGSLIDWNGSVTGGLWSNASNWTPNTVPGSADYARIGVSLSYKNNPVVAATTSVGAINMGYLLGTTTGKDKIITINANQTLTVNADITQLNNTNSSSVKSKSTFNGPGILTCQNVTIGDAVTTPANSNTVSQDSTAISSLVGTFNINGNINMIANLSPNGNVGYFPVFNLDANNLNLTGSIVTSNVGGTRSNSYFTSFWTGRFNSNNSTNPNTFTCYNVATITLPVADNQTVDFNNTGSTAGIVNYASASNGQKVYTTGDSYIGTAGGNYQNLTFSGAGSKIVDNGALTITNNWISGGTGSVDLYTNDPTITVGNSWTNTTNTTQGSGDISVVGYTQNNSGTLQLGTGNLTTGGIQNSGGTIQGGAGPGKVTVGPSLFQNNGGTYVCNAEDLYINGDYQNTSVFTAGTGTVYFNNTTGAQSLQDISSAGTTFNNVSFSGGALTNAKTMSGSGGFAVSATGTLSLANNATTKVDAGGVLTLKSTASSTATVAQIQNTASKIIGVVNVQRYITGGSGYRGYRLMSSPVNVSLNTGGGGSTGITYIGKSPQPSFGGTTFNGAFTGGPGTGFTLNGIANPSMYLYDESLTTNNTSFVAGKNVGIYSITSDSTVTITSGKPASQTTGVKIPVGNSFLFFFIGDNSKSTTSAASRPSPENTTVTSYGYLNQGSVTVKFWSKTNTPNNTSIPYHTGTGGVLPGYNQLGNPYASTIDLTSFYSHNNGGSISNIFWEMNEPGQKYISYTIGGATSDPKASKYIVSGQGFIIQALAINKTVTFLEADKITYPSGFVSTNTSTPALLMSTKGDIPLLNRSFASSVAEESPLTGLHIQIKKDSIANAACGIYFSKTNDDNFHDAEDAIDLDGGSVYMSSYSSDGVRTGINQLADYKEKGKRIKLFVKAATSGLYNLNLLDIKNVDTVNYKIYLVDKLKKDSLDIGKYKTYAFNLVTTDTTSFGANRFELSINQLPASKYQLATFTAQKANDGVLLTWRTLNEGSNYFFTLEKQQTNGTDYSPLYNIQSNGGTIYKYTDKTPNAGNNVYRLKQVDLFGNITYSNPINIYYDKSGNESMFSIYPNPTAETLNVNITYGLTTTTTASYKLNIYDATGSLVMQKTSDASKWSENISQFKPGIYIVELKGNSGISLGKAKFVKQ